MDLAVWGPFGHRIKRKLRLSGQTLGANSVFRTFLLCGFLSVFEWQAGWAIFKTGASMLQVLRVKMATNYAGRCGVEAWALTHQADVGARLEHMSRVRHDSAEASFDGDKWMD